MFKLDLEKAAGPTSLDHQIANILGSSKKQEFQINTYFCFIEYTKAFDCVDHNKL